MTIQHINSYYPYLKQSYNPKIFKLECLEFLMVKKPQKKGSVWTNITTKKEVEKKGIIKPLPQVPGTRKSVKADFMRKARVPGKRLSRTGNEYFETRENRSDKRGSRL